MDISKSKIRRLFELRTEILIQTIETEAFAKIGIGIEKTKSYYKANGKEKFINQMTSIILTKIQRNEFYTVEEYIELLQTIQKRDSTKPKSQEDSVIFGINSEFSDLVNTLQTILKSEILKIDRDTILTKGWQYFCQNNQCSFEIPPPKELKGLMKENKLDEIQIEWRFKAEYKILCSLFSILEEIHIILILSNYFIVNFYVEFLRNSNESFILFQSDLTNLRFEFYKILYDLLISFGYNLEEYQSISKNHTILRMYDLIYKQIELKFANNPELRETLSHSIYIEPPYLC